MANKYAEQMAVEKELLSRSNPFSSRTGKRPRPSLKKPIKISPPIKTSHFEPKEKSNNYFSLILGSDYEDLEVDIRGLRYISYMKGGKEVIKLERKENHYLSESGAEDLLMELKGHISTDIKLGFLTEKEFLKTQQIITSTLIKYIRNNLQKLGMDTEDKQRKARPLIVMILNRIRSVYSQSIQGTVNKRSHGDITLSGGLDNDMHGRFDLQDQKN